MALLAEQKRKVKYGLDPQNTSWSNDTSKFGQRLMEKMGWEKGKGLGANENGMTEHIKASYKSDTRGMGFTPQAADAWIAHQDDFNDLLKMLNSQSEASSQEERKETDGHKRYYGRFARGQVPTLRSTDDLDCIFGRRKASSKIAGPNKKSTASADCVEAKEESRHGLTTVTSTSSVQEYFAKKMAEMKARKDGNTGQKCIVVDTSNNETSEKRETDCINSEHAKENKTALYGAVNLLYTETDLNPAIKTVDQTCRNWYQNFAEDGDITFQKVVVEEKSSKKKKRRTETDDNENYIEIKTSSKKKHITLEESVSENTVTDSLELPEENRLFKETRNKEKKKKAELKCGNDNQICTIADIAGSEREEKQQRKKRKRNCVEDIVIHENLDIDAELAGEISGNIKKRKIENGNVEISSNSRTHSTKESFADNTEIDCDNVQEQRKNTSEAALDTITENDSQKRKKKKQKRKHIEIGTDKDSKPRVSKASSNDSKDMKSKKEKKRKDIHTSEPEADAVGSVNNINQNDGKKIKKEKKRKDTHTSEPEGNAVGSVNNINQNDGKKIKSKKEKKRKDTHTSEPEGDAVGSVNNIKQNDHVAEEHDINKNVAECNSIGNATHTPKLSKQERKLTKQERKKKRKMKKAELKEKQNAKSHALFPGSNIADIAGYGLNKTAAGQTVRVK